jgi:hypothetical protein
MKHRRIRMLALFSVVVFIAEQAWAPPARPAPPRPSRPSSGGTGRLRIPEAPRPFKDILREPASEMRRGETQKDPDADALRKLLHDKEKLTLEDIATLEAMKRDYRLSSEERSIIRRELDKLKPKETAAEASAREFHDGYLPGGEILLSSSTLAAPHGLRDLLALHVVEIGQTREQMHTFHRGLERLRRSGWDAESSLALASETARAAEARARRDANGRIRIRPLSREKPPPPLPREIEILLPSDGGREWKRYAHRILTGQDAAVSLAYVDFLFAGALSGAGELATLAKLKTARKPAPAESEAAQLRELTRLLVHDARLRTAKSVLPHLPELARRLVDPSVHRFAAALPGDIVTLAAKRAGKEIVALEKMPEWRRAEKLRDAIEGFTSSATTIDLYLRSADSMNLVRVDRKSGQTFLLLGEPAKGAFREHCRAQIRKYSRPGFRLANVLRAEGGYRILMADRSVRVTNAEAGQLERGERLPPKHALSRAIARDPSFVVYSHPLMAREGRYRSDADRLAFAVQRSYREARVFKDDLSDLTESRARAVNDFVIANASDVVVLKAAESFKVDDGNIINDVAEELTRSGIQVEELKTEGVTATSERARLVIVISGHINADLAAFVRRAGEAGYFKNNIVAFNSCASELTSQLVHEINTRYGAVATYRYEGKIPAAKVQEILLELNDAIDRKPNLEDWKRFVLEKGLTGVWNICTLASREQYVG